MIFSKVKPRSLFQPPTTEEQRKTQTHKRAVCNKPLFEVLLQGCQTNKNIKNNNNSETTLSSSFNEKLIKKTKQKKELN